MRKIDKKTFLANYLVKKINLKTLLVISSYLIITIFLSWPLILHLDGFLLSKNYKDISHSDTKVHMKYMLKSKELFLDGKDFIVLPSDYSLAQTYNLLGIFSIIVLGLNEIVFHNLFFLFCIFLSGLFMYFLMLELSKNKLASFFAGFIYMSSNYLFHQYIFGHTHYIQIQWIPLVFLFLEKTLNYKKFKYAIFLAISLSLLILSSSQYTVYLSFIIPVYLLLRIYFVDKKILIDKHFYLNIAISNVLAFVFSSFYIFKRIHSSSIIRTIGENMGKWWVLSYFGQLLSVKTNINLGGIQFILIFLGIIVILAYIKDKNYRKYIPFAILLIFLIICMAGPFSLYAPYYWLYKFWPFINRFRVPIRLFPFVLMCSSILSSLFLLYIQKMKKLKKYRVVILILVIIMIIIFQILNSHWLSNHHIFYP